MSDPGYRVGTGSNDQWIRSRPTQIEDEDDDEYEDDKD